MEEYNKKLEKRLSSLIDNYIICKRNEMTDELERKINLANIEKFHLNEEEFNYIMNALKEKGIIVVGDLEKVYCDYENYRYHYSRDNTKRSIKYVKLSNEEQKELLKKYRENKDKDAITKLVGSYEPLINIEASRTSRIYDIEIEDLKSDAYLALLSAFNNFDFRGNTLVAYASKYIRTSLLKRVREYYGLYHYADYSRFFHARNNTKYKYYYGQEYDEYEHIDEIIEKFSLKESAKYVDSRMINLVYALSLDEVEEQAYIDFPYEEIINPMIEEKLKQEISQIMNEELTPAQNFDILNYYGLEGNKAVSQVEIAKLRNCSFQNVSQSIKVAHRKLAKRLKKEM